jgi:hypothetical protein
MSFVKVWTEVSDGKCQSLPAKIISKNGNVFKIKYISSTDDRDSKNRRIYRFEDETYDITDESITEYVYSELDLGFQDIGEETFVKYDYDIGITDDEEDEDYVPSSEEDDEDDEISSSGGDEEEFEEDDDDYEDD